MSRRTLESRHGPAEPGPDRAGTARVLARLAALKTAATTELQVQWRDLFGTEPPRAGRAYLESRLAYRIQELAHGGLKPATVARLDALAAHAGDDREAGARSALSRPVTGTRLIRSWQGVDHTVTVLDDGYEYQGRPYRSLSAVARAITGTRWNGWLFFGLKAGGA